MAGNPTMVSGVRDRVNLATNREDVDYAKGVALLDPNANPFTLATMDMKTQISRSVDYHWWEDELVPETAQVNYGTGYSSSATSIVMDTGSGARFAIGDLVMHNASGEVMLVTGVSTDTLTVDRDYGQSEGWTAKAASIADNDYFTIVGNAFEQGHPLPAIKSTKTVEYKNYHQEFRTPVGMTEVVDATDQRGEDDMTLQDRKAAITHQRKLEYGAFWGKPYVGDKGIYASGTGNTAPTTMGGINHFIEYYGASNQKLDEDEITEREFQDFLEYVFEYGSETKICYCPPRLRTALDAWGISKMQTFTREKMYGMAVDVWHSSHGTVIFKTHKMLKQPQSGQYLYSFFLDMEQLAVSFLQKIGATRKRMLTPYEATGETVMKHEWATHMSMKFGLAPHHARLRFKTYA